MVINISKFYRNCKWFLFCVKWSRSWGGSWISHRAYQRSYQWDDSFAANWLENFVSLPTDTRLKYASVHILTPTPKRFSLNSDKNISFVILLKYNGDVSAIESTCWSSRDPKFDSQHQQSLTLVPEDLIPSSGLLRHCIHMVHTYTCRQKKPYT